MSEIAASSAFADRGLETLLLVGDGQRVGSEDHGGHAFWRSKERIAIRSERRGDAGHVFGHFQHALRSGEHARRDLRCRRVGRSVGGEELGEQRSQLGEHQHVSVCDGCRHVLRDGLDGLRKVIVREVRECPAGDPVIDPLEKTLHLLVAQDGVLSAPGQHVAANGGAGGLRRPDRECTPGGVLADAGVAQLYGELVVALRDEEVAEDRVLLGGDLVDRQSHHGLNRRSSRFAAPVSNGLLVSRRARRVDPPSGREEPSQ